MSAEIIAALHAIVGDAGLKTGDTDTESFLTDWHGQYRGATISQFNNQYRSQIHTLSAPRRSAFLFRITESVFRELLAIDSGPIGIDESD